MVVEGDDGKRLLIDTPPELRLQMVRERIPTVDAVLYTHDHADHVHGIDDLRAISHRSGPLKVYGPQETLDTLAQRFSYIFDNGIPPPPGSFKPELEATPIEEGREITLAGMPVLPLEINHGPSRVFGYRIGPLAYLTDVKTVPDRTRRRLAGVRILVMSALLEQEHPTHQSIDEAVRFTQEMKPEQTYLTHLTHLHTHEELSARLPAGIEPAYDGLTIVF